MKFIVLFFVFISYAYAAKIQINVLPKEPVVNEEFTVEISVKGEKIDALPVVKFDPLGVSLVEEFAPTHKTTHMYVNGKSSMSKTYTYRYILQANTPGPVYLRNIEANVDGKVIRHKTKIISILREAKKVRPVFFKAEFEKDAYYPGESIVVKYNLYSRVDYTVRNYDVKKFPKLEKFLKRFHKEDLKASIVQVGNYRFRKRTLYTTQLFAQASGMYKIDPMEIRVLYAKNSSSFGGFGFNIGGQERSTSLKSPSVEVNVVPIEKEFPENFSGLVGSHSFKLKMNKNKFVNNEPIELTLDIQGDGALELFEAPSLINNQNIEEFDKSDELQIKQDYSAQKTINYTYIGREKVDLKNVEYTLSTFNPETKEFEEHRLKIGDLKVIVIANTTKKSEVPNSKPNKKIENGLNINFDSEEYVFGFLKKTMASYIYQIKDIFIFSLVLLIFSILFFCYKLSVNLNRKDLSEDDLVLKKGLDYGTLYKVLTKIGPSGSMSQIIENSKLDAKTKTYFLSLVDTFNNKYDMNLKIKVNKKYWLELTKLARFNDKDESIFDIR